MFVCMGIHAHVAHPFLPSFHILPLFLPSFLPSFHPSFSFGGQFPSLRPSVLPSVLPLLIALISVTNLPRFGAYNVANRDAD